YLDIAARSHKLLGSRICQLEDGMAGVRSGENLQDRLLRLRQEDVQRPGLRGTASDAGRPRSLWLYSAFRVGLHGPRIRWSMRRAALAASSSHRKWSFPLRQYRTGQYQSRRLL